METSFAEKLRGAGRASPGEMILLALLGLAVVGGSAMVFLKRAEPPAPRIERTEPARDVEHPQGAHPTSRSTKIVIVHVSGLVTAPGVYELPEDSRVKDAIAAAGGPREGGDIEALNLAAPLSDGQKITVGRPGEALAAEAVPGSEAEGNPGAGPALLGQKINLNTATAAELDTLPSIGPVLADRILSFRQQKGRFTSVSQLRDIEGIGPKKYEGMKDLVTV